MLPLVVTVESATGQKRRFAFADSPVRIGRSPLAELQLEEAFVSRWQGTIRFNEREVTYCNVSSTNVTFVGDREAAAHDDVPVGPDAPLRLGSLVLRFSREPVAEGDLRRKGKARPVQKSERAESKTVWLGAAEQEALKSLGVTPSTGAAAPQTDGQRAPASAPPLPSAPVPAAPPSSQPPAPGAVVQVRSIAIHTLVPRSGAPAPSHSSPPAPTPSEPAMPAGTAPEAPTSQNRDDLEWLATNYRDGWSQFFRGLRGAIERAQPSQRAALAEELQRRFPQITMESEFRDYIKSLGLEPRKLDIPEVTLWLRSVAEGILPPKFHLDTGLTLQRILTLIEVLSQSFAEINDAQQSVRSRWLGRAARTSVLKSDDGRVVLAYMLNPKGDWEERLAEFEEAAREVVVHEFALFKATLGGARELLELLSPAAIAETEGIDPAELSQEVESSPGLWKRIMPKEGPEQRLWRRFVTVYEGLREGERYQRAFMGRAFARTYLAAMGNQDTSPGKDKER